MWMRVLGFEVVVSFPPEYLEAFEAMGLLENPKVPDNELWFVDPRTGEVVGKIVNLKKELPVELL